VAPPPPLLQCACRTLNQQVYQDVQKSRPPYPGGPDLYRRRQYRMCYDDMRWTVHVDGAPAREDKPAVLASPSPP
jgi:hypothetical protein